MPYRRHRAIKSWRDQGSEIENLNSSARSCLLAFSNLTPDALRRCASGRLLAVGRRTRVERLDLAQLLAEAVFGEHGVNAPSASP